MKYPIRSGTRRAGRESSWESAAWEAAGITGTTGLGRANERAETAVYVPYRKNRAIDRALKLKSCAANNHMGKRLFASIETWDENISPPPKKPAKAAETARGKAAGVGDAF